MNDPKNSRPGAGSSNRKVTLIIAVLFLAVAGGGIWQVFRGGNGVAPICSPATVSGRTLEIVELYRKARKENAPTEALGVVFDGQFGAFRSEIGGITCAIDFLNESAAGSAAPESYKAALTAISEGDVTLAAVVISEIRDGLLAEGEGSNPAAAVVVSHLGALWFYDDLPKTLEIYKEASALDPENVEVWIWVANILRWNDQFETAVSIYELGLSLSEETQDRALSARLYANLGRLYVQKGELNNGIENFIFAGEILETLQDKAGLAEIYGYLGETFARTVASGADSDQAIQYLDKANELNVELGRLDYAATGFSQLGQLYMADGNPEQAAEALFKALEFASTIEDLPMIADRSSDLGMTYWILDELDKAGEYLARSLAANQELGNISGLAQQHENLGYLSDELGDTQATCTHWTAALALYRELEAEEPVEHYGQLVEELGCG